jgi:hypothetical protein
MSNNPSNNISKNSSDKNFSRRSFLKFIAGFIAIFSFGGIGTILGSSQSKDKNVQNSSEGYGGSTYGF